MRRPTPTDVTVDNISGGRSFAEILAGVRTGSEPDLQALAAFCTDRLRLRCHRRLVRYQVFGIVDADDVVNDILQDLIGKLQSDGLPGLCDGLTFEKWANVEIRQRTAKAYRRYQTDRAHFHRNPEIDSEESLAEVVDPVSNTGFVDCSDELDFAISMLTEEMREIARLHLTRCSQTQIAGQLGLSTRTVSRKLKVIYAIWRNSAT